MSHHSLLDVNEAYRTALWKDILYSRKLLSSLLRALFNYLGLVKQDTASSLMGQVQLSDYRGPL